MGACQAQHRWGRLKHPFDEVFAVRRDSDARSRLSWLTYLQDFSAHGGPRRTALARASEDDVEP